MPSQRRTRLFGALFLVTIIVILYTTRSSTSTHASDFYTKTADALQAHEYAAAAAQRDADSVGTRLKAAEDAAKKAATDKGAEYRQAVGGEKSIAGRVKIEDGKPSPVPGVATQGGRPREQAVMEGETNEDHDVEIELNAILKKSPIIIFSKSYCPFSARAKHILLSLYTINPAPYVVELDKHPLGARLQDTLAQMTGRRTVPNIMVQGKSIGGGDDVQELDDTDKLVETVVGLGGTRVKSVVRNGARAVKSGGEMRRARA